MTDAEKIAGGWTLEERLARAEKEWLRGRGSAAAASASAWLRSYAATIVGNVRLSVTNVHIRYEHAPDAGGALSSVPRTLLAAGVTLASLRAITVDAEGAETFATAGALERVRKARPVARLCMLCFRSSLPGATLISAVRPPQSVELSRLAVYLDSDAAAWAPLGGWESLSQADAAAWDTLFAPGVADDIPDAPDAAEGALEGAALPPAARQYVLSPVRKRLPLLASRVSCCVLMLRARAPADERQPDVRAAWQRRRAAAGRGGAMRGAVAGRRRAVVQHGAVP